MKTSIYCLFVIIIISMISCKQKEYATQEVGENIYFVDGNDRVLIGNKSFKKDLFKEGVSNLLFKNNFNEFSCKEVGNSRTCEAGGKIDECEWHHHNYEEIFGVYINKKMLDNLSFNKKKPGANHINLIYIYPEKERYNYQCSQVVGIKIVEYVDPWYQENPPLDLNPYTIDSVIKIDNNKIRFFSKEKNFDFITQPNINININTWSTTDTDAPTTAKPINSYIRLDDAITSINFSVDSLQYIYPQDLTEIYLRELTTRLLNLKNRTNYNTLELTKQ